MKWKQWRSRILIVTAYTCFLGLLLGCSNNDSKADTPSMTFWHDKTGVAAEAVTAIAQSFQDEHPEIKVNTVYVADLSEGGGQKLLTAIAGGDPPDAVFFDRFQIASWANQQALTDLTDRVAASSLDPNRFYKASWSEVVYEDKVYGIPVTIDGRVLFYNKDHFKEAGLDPDQPPSTIRQLEEYAGKLNLVEGNGFKRFGFVPWFSQGNFYTWGWVFGGEFYNDLSSQVTANEPHLVEALTWLQMYARQYNMSAVRSITDSKQVSPFAAGQISMEIGNNLEAATIKANNPSLNYGVAPIPTPDGNRQTTWSGGFSLVIPRGAKNPDAAWELVQYFAGDKAQETVGKVYLSVIPEVNERLFKDDPVNKQIMSLLDIAHWRPVIPQGQLLWNELVKAMDLAISGNAEPESILSDVTSKVNAELKQSQQR